MVYRVDGNHRCLCSYPFELWFLRHRISEVRIIDCLIPASPRSFEIELDPDTEYTWIEWTGRSSRGAYSYDVPWIRYGCWGDRSMGDGDHTSLLVKFSVISVTRGQLVTNTSSVWSYLDISSWSKGYTCPVDRWSTAWYHKRLKTFLNMFGIMSYSLWCCSKNTVSIDGLEYHDGNTLMRRAVQDMRSRMSREWMIYLKAVYRYMTPSNLLYTNFVTAITRPQLI